MTFEEVKDWVKYYGYDVHMTGGDHKWLSAMKDWDFTNQTIALEVQIKDNGEHAFKFTHMLMNGIVITTGELSPLTSEVHFLKWQLKFMQTIQKLV